MKNPIGEFIKTEDGSQTWQIVGIIKDMITQSPYEPVAGTFYFLDNNYRGKQLTLKINPNESAAAALPKIEAVLKNPKVQQIE